MFQFIKFLSVLNQLNQSTYKFVQAEKANRRREREVVLKVPAKNNNNKEDD